MNKSELDAILAEHALWLSSDDAEGLKANLREANLRGADLREADLRGADLSGADLSGADLSGAGLTRAGLTRADLSGADLSGADLSEANLHGADLTRAGLTRANLRSADLREAALGDAALGDADLSGADLSGADLSGASLDGADLRNADLSGANLREADFTRINLSGADLSRTNLAGINLGNADLRGADLREADLREAYLSGADLSRADLSGADLSGADLSGADLSGAGLTRADLSGADLSEANLHGADLSGADLRNADLSRAGLTRADLREANLHGADLREADLREADLREADLRNADLENAVRDDDDEQGDVNLTQALGRMTRSVSKLKKHPLKAGAFKKLFPSEFEKVKSFSQGKDFTPELLSQLIKKHGFYWSVVPGKYSNDAQRVCSSANDVLMLCVDISDPVYSDADRDIFRSVKEISVRSGHPVAKKSSLFTVGWVRYCEFPDRILIEEVQSDVGGVRKGLKDEDFVNQLAWGGLSAEDLDRSMALMQPFSDRFYEDAIGLIFDMAEEQGKKVEMLDYAQKKAFGSPKSVYSDLPKSMGMKLAPSEALPYIGQVWSYTPNRKRRRPALPVTRSRN